MLKTTLFAAVAAVLLIAGPASAQKIDANGRCHDAKGQFAKAEVCGGASRTMTTAKTTKSTTTTAAAAAPATSMTTAKAEKCRDSKGHFVSCNAASATGAAANASAGATKSTRCKNDKGKFAKCGTPGAHPA